MKTYYCITKYNPDNYDDETGYQLDEWTAYCDIGKSFDGVKLTKEIFLEKEAQYIHALFKILDFYNAKSIRLYYFSNFADLYKKRDFVKNDDLDLYAFFKSIRKGMLISSQEDIEKMFKISFREYHGQVEIKFGRTNQTRIHFSSDSYMYLYTKKDISPLKIEIEKIGLYVW